MTHFHVVLLAAAFLNYELELQLCQCQYSV